jgi:tight adherence protein B
MPPAGHACADATTTAVASALLFVLTAAVVWLGYRPVRQLIAWQKHRFRTVLQRQLLMATTPTTAMALSAAVAAALAAFGYTITGSALGAGIGLLVGVLLPNAMLRILSRRRLARLEDQLVGGIQTLVAGVRAGLNLVQAMELVARDGPDPIRQEFSHLLREYEYGVPLDEAMRNAAARIGSGDYRLLFAALQTHRERGGDLGATLDRIADSIREIQRLEKRVQTLTAQGRATARWLGAMPAVVFAILYLLVDKAGVRALFTDDLGKLIVAVIVALNLVGFLWIRKIVSIDI